MGKRKIVDVMANDEMRRRLSSLGIFPGQIIEVMDNIERVAEGKPSGMILIVKNARYFINQDLANCITWKEIENE
jgi:Fe2+ transport system protein FeoA